MTAALITDPIDTLNHPLKALDNLFSFPDAPFQQRQEWYNCINKAIQKHKLFPSTKGMKP